MGLAFRAGANQLLTSTAGQSRPTIARSGADFGSARLAAGELLMSVLIWAGAFFALLILVTAYRARRSRPAPIELSPMRAALERRIRDHPDSTL